MNLKYLITVYSEINSWNSRIFNENQKRQRIVTCFFEYIYKSRLIIAGYEALFLLSAPRAMI